MSHARSWFAHRRDLAAVSGDAINFDTQERYSSGSATDGVTATCGDTAGRAAYKKMLVIADDLGASDAVNQGIIRAFELGLLSGASAMANGPELQSAVDAVVARNLSSRIGMHLVLTEGHPLTTLMAEQRRFCDGTGRFCGARPSALARFSASERWALREEVRTQLRHLRELGFAVRHLDSHQHIHTVPAIAREVVAVALEEGVTRVRLGRNLGTGRSVSNRAYKLVLNGYLRRKGLSGVRSFGSAVDVRASGRTAEATEVMVHPRLDSSGALLDSSSGWEDPLVERLRGLVIATSPV